MQGDIQPPVCVLNIYTTLKSRETEPMNNNRILEKQFLEGNDGVYILLYNGYVDQLYSYGRGLGFDKETLKDAIHDVFLNLLVKRSKLKDVRNLRAYLFRSLHNRLVDIKRKEIGTTDADTSTAPEMYVTVTVLDNIIDIEQERILTDALEKLINGLSPMQRSAIYMRFMYEMEYSELADILEVTPHAARKFVSKGINNIRSRKERLMLMMVMGAIPPSDLSHDQGGQNDADDVLNTDTSEYGQKLQ